MPDGNSTLAHHEPESHGLPRSAEVLQFRPRAHLGEPAFADATRPARESAEAESELLDDLAQFEQDREEEDETVNYSQRMLMNVIAVAVITILLGIGIWLADTIADMQRDQDCVLQGRQNCAPIIDVPGPTQH